MRHIFLALAMFLAQLTFAQVPNDECTGALALTPSSTCTTVNGSIQGATKSTITTACSTNGDVFYKFVAGSPSAVITVAPETGLDLQISLLDACGATTALMCKDGGGYGVAETITATSLIVGTTYYVKIGSVLSTFTKYKFTICVTGSVNDECTSALAITPTATCSSFTYGTLLDATTSTITPSCTSYNDVFYKFVATATAVKIRTLPGGTSLDIVLSVFDNCSAAALNCVDDNGLGLGENIFMSGLTIGKTYYIKIASKTLNPAGKTVSLCVQNAPVNDNCSNATTLTPSATCSTVNGTLDISTPSTMASSCTADNDVFYKFVANSASSVIKVVPSSGLDAVIGVFTACDGAPLVCANDQLLGGTETLTLSGLTLGSTYYIKVASVDAALTTSAFTICVQNPPANDQCTGAVALLGGSTTCSPLSGTLYFASTSTLSDACSGNKDVFYKFTASAPTAVVMVAPAAGLDATVSIFNGCTDLSSLYCVNEVGSGVTENVRLSSLTPGTVYYIKVASVDVEPSAYTFTICVKNPPVNDECAGAVAITASIPYNPVAGDLIEATTSSSITTCTGFNDVFYKFTALANAATITVTPPAGLDVRVGAFAACNATDPIGCVNAGGDAATEILRLTDLTFGKVYFIKVSSVVASPAVTTFNIAVQNPPSNDQCDGASFLNNTSTCSPTNGTLVNATNSTIQSSCPIYNDVFYSYTASTNGASITVTPASGLDAVVSLYDACAGTLIACVNTGSAGISEILNTNKLVIGTTYKVQVGSAVQLPASATFTICVQSKINDEKEFAKVLSATSGWCDNNIALDNGTQSPGKMPCDNSTDPMFNFSHDLWFTFVATSTKYNINASRPVSNSYGVELLTESGVSLLCERGSIKGGTSPAATVVTSISTLTVGNTYYIRMGKDGFGGLNEVFSLCVTPVIVPVPPVNDLCSAPTALIVGNAAVDGTLVNAVSSTTSTTCNTYNDVFYSFTATSQSADIIVTPVSNLDAVISVFTSCGSGLVKCTNAAATGVKETLNVDALVVGQQYIVQVGNAGSVPNSGDAPTFTIAVEKNQTTGVLSNESEYNSMLVFPNPASGSITVKTPLKGSQKLEMFSYRGDRVLQMKSDNSEYLLNVESIPDGVYFLLVSDNNGNQQTQKVSIVK